MRRRRQALAPAAALEAHSEEPTHPMYPPIESPVLGLFALVLIMIFAFLEIGLIEAAYERLGISHRAVMPLLLGMILGSYVNLPVGRLPAKRLIEDQIVYFWGIPYVVPRAIEAHSTIIAINVGGALIPLLVCVYLLVTGGRALKSLLAALLVSLVVWQFSRVVPGVGIAVPTFTPGIAAAVVAWLLDRYKAPSLAYVAGTLGCLLGADIYNLGLLSELRAPVASIGGAGTFDGVFVSGVIAVLLA